MEPLLSSVSDTILSFDSTKVQNSNRASDGFVKVLQLTRAELVACLVAKKSFTLKGAAAARLSSWSPNYDNEVPPFLPLYRSLRQRVFTLDQCLWRRHFFDLLWRALFHHDHLVDCKGRTAPLLYYTCLRPTKEKILMASRYAGPVDICDHILR